MSQFSFNICKSCKSLLYSEYCNYCKTQVIDAVTLNSSDEQVEAPATDIVDAWIGPLKTPCKKCNGSNCVYYQICDPASADQPAKIVFNCNKCKHTASQYKN